MFTMARAFIAFIVMSPAFVAQATESVTNGNTAAESAVRFLPVMGNHDLTSGSRDYIYEIDAGNAGVSGGRTTAVFLRVAGGDIHCVMVRIDPEAETAVVQDRWEINGSDSSYQGEHWTFSAIADPRVIGNSRKPEGRARRAMAHRAIKGTLKELRDMRGAPLMGRPEFVVVAGDMSVGYTHAVAWQEIFGAANNEK
jgi:hypothetical protein